MAVGNSQVEAGRCYIRFKADTTQFDAGLKKAQERFKSVSMAMAGFNKITNSVRRYTRGMANVFTDLKTSVSRVANTMLMFGGAASAGIGFSVREFMSFDDVMKQVSAISGATGKDLEMLTETAKKLGATTAFTAKQTAEGELTLARMGFSSNEINNSIQSMLDLTRATGEGVERLGYIAEQSGNIMRSFGYSASQASRVNDILSFAANNSAQDISKLNNAMAKAGPIAKTLGIGLSEVVSLFMTLANRGISGEFAGTSVGTMLSQLSKNKERIKIEYGIDISDESGNLRNIFDIIEDFKKKVNGVGTANNVSLFQDVFDVRGSRAALILSENTKEIRKFFKRLQIDSGEIVNYAKRKADDMESGIGGRVRLMKSRIQDLMITIGRLVDKYFMKYQEAFSGIIKEISEFIEKHGDLIAEIVPVTAAVLSLGAALKMCSFALSGFNVVVETLKISVIPLRVAILSVVESLCLLDGICMAVSGTFAFLGLQMTSVNFAKFASSITLSFGKVANALTGFKSIISNVFSTINNMIRGTRGISAGFIRLTSLISNEVKRAVVSSLVIVQNTLPSIMKKASTSIVAIKKATVSMLSKIMIAFRITFQVIGGIVADSFNMFKMLFSGIAVAAGTVFGFLKTGVLSVGRTIMAYSAPFFKFFLSHLAIIGTAVAIVATSIYAIPKAFSAVKGVLGSLFETMKGYLSSVFDGFGERFSNVMEVFGSGDIKGAMKIFFGLIKNTFERAIVPVENFFAKVKYYYVGVRDFFKYNIAELILNLKSIFVGIGDFLYDVFSSAIYKIVEIISKIGGSIVWVGEKIGLADKGASQKLFDVDFSEERKANREKSRQNLESIEQQIESNRRDKELAKRTAMDEYLKNGFKQYEDVSFDDFDKATEEAKAFAKEKNRLEKMNSLFEEAEGKMSMFRTSKGLSAENEYMPFIKSVVQSVNDVYKNEGKEAGDEKRMQVLEKYDKLIDELKSEFKEFQKGAIKDRLYTSDEESMAKDYAARKGAYATIMERVQNIRSVGDQMAQTIGNEDANKSTVFGSYSAAAVAGNQYAMTLHETVKKISDKVKGIEDSLSSIEDKLEEMSI